MTMTTTKATHTPAPWVFVELLLDDGTPEEPECFVCKGINGGPNSYQHDYCGVASEDDRYRDSVIYEHDGSIYVSAANAHLIEAAPDLLAACEAAADYIAGVLPDAEQGPVVDALRAAIAKAKP
jgi:hypothetical protein